MGKAMYCPSWKTSFLNNELLEISTRTEFQKHPKMIIRFIPVVELQNIRMIKTMQELNLLTVGLCVTVRGVHLFEKIRLLRFGCPLDSTEVNRLFLSPLVNDGMVTRANLVVDAEEMMKLLTAL